MHNLANDVKIDTHAVLLHVDCDNNVLDVTVRKLSTMHKHWKKSPNKHNVFINIDPRSDRHGLEYLLMFEGSKEGCRRFRFALLATYNALHWTNLKLSDHYEPASLTCI